MIERFESVNELLERMEDSNYEPDLIFMDIFMPESGEISDSPSMEAAKKLRDMGSRAKLFFLTTSGEYAAETCEVYAAQHLIKPITEKGLFDVPDNCLENKREKQKRYILIKEEGRFIRVAVNDIVYCEAQGKTQCLYLADGGECRQRMTMTDLYELLSPYREFVRIGAAFIVNMDYIESLSAQDISLTDGKKIYLPRGAYRGLREQYFDYYCKTC